MKKNKKAIKITIIAAICLVVMVGIAFGIYFLGAPSHDNVIMIGHRGYSSKYVDNTASSFIGAAKHGSRGVETDVRYTKDGYYVLSHDSYATFNDGTSLVVSDSTLEELLAKPLKNTKNDEIVYLCTLQEYLEICKAYNMICFIELKGEYDNEQIKSVFNYIQQYYTLEMCELQSFNFDVLVEAQKMFPNLNFMLTWGKDRGDYRKCFDYGFDIDSSYYSLTKEMVQEFHERGLKVASWTCNTQISMYYSYWFNVDFIESDVY